MWVENLRYRGAKGVVLFNRFFEPDIDIHAMKVVPADIFSNPSDIRHTLRWVAIASHLIPDLDISASTGVHDGEAMVKMLLAGAKSVQVCSAIYRNGPKHIEVMLNTLTDWMNQKGYKSICDFRGKLNVGSIPDPTQYERSQFMKLLLKLRIMITAERRFLLNQNSFKSFCNSHTNGWVSGFSGFTVSILRFKS